MPLKRQLHTSLEVPTSCNIPELHEHMGVAILNSEPVEKEHRFKASLRQIYRQVPDLDVWLLDG